MLHRTAFTIILPMGSSAFDTRAAARRLTRRWEERSERAEKRRREAREWASQLAATLGAADPSVRKIVGFGSTFETWRRYREDSDVDLGIVGGDWQRLSSLIPSGPFDVSLVELDLQPESFAGPVLRNGVVLYERSGTDPSASG
ncbi:MAG: hypothetical protein EA427_11585 [Spirochaetaceae bacterium]|nr:MAG: hypothetical protein EA427_11585 [Spirochaetaceae bacterium]